jgi:hypothetical protein
VDEGRRDRPPALHRGTRHRFSNPLNSNGTITGVASGRCLDVAQNGTANGSRIQLWDCTGGANQAWSRA